MNGAKTKQPTNNWSQLMAAAQCGDNKQYQTLLEEVSNYLRPFLTRKLGSTEHREDVLQEILITIHRVRHSFDTSRPFKPWLHTIAHSRIMEFWRKTKRRGERECLYTDEDADRLVAEEEISQLELGSLKTALDKLSEKQRKIVMALKFEGHSVAETANLLNMSESAVKVAAHRSYKVIMESIHGAK